jgi:hypothetical protein
VIDLCIVTAFVLLVVVSIGGYVWLKDRPEGAKFRAEAEEFIREEEAVYRSLESLGDIDVQPDGLTRAKLEDRFHKPALIRASSYNSTRLGWACGLKQCALWFDFLDSPDHEVRQTAAPAAITVNGVVLGCTHTHRIAVGGVYLGESVEEMKNYCKGRGYGRETGYHRISWDKDWTIIWTDIAGSRVLSFSFLNQKQIGNAQTQVKR